MPIFTYQSGVWNSIKGLFFNSASTTYSNAKSGWVYDGTSWRISYPSFPVNTVLPVLTGTVAYLNTITVNTGTWDTTAVVAVNPTTNYSYQWLRDGVAIADTPVGTSTTNSYVCQAADVGKQLSCRVTATNGRGGTPVVTASQLVVPRITVTPKYTDTTPTPAQVGSLTGTQETNPYDWKITFTKGLNTDVMEVTQTGSGGSITYTSPSLSATGNSNGTSPVTVTVTSINNTCKATIDTFAAIGATGYRIKLDSGAEIPLGSTATSYEFTGVSLGAHTVTVVPYFNTTPGIGASVSFTSVRKTNTTTTNITTKTLAAMGTVTLTDNQPTPSGFSNPTVTASGVRGWSASFTVGNNYDSISVSANSGTTTYTSPNASATGTAGVTATSVVVTVTATNSTASASVSWGAITGAAKYAYRINSGTEYETTGTSLNLSSSTTPALVQGANTVSVVPISNTYNGGTFRGTGNTSSSITSGNKTQITSNPTAVALFYPPSDPTLTYTPNKQFLWVNSTFYAQTSSTQTSSASGSTGNPTPTYSYQWEGQYSDGGAWSSLSPIGQTAAYQLPSSSNGFAYRPTVTAKNTISGTVYSSGTVTGESTGPIVKVSNGFAPPPVTGLTAANDNSPTGGTFRWTNPGTLGVGTGYHNYNNAPIDLWDWELYRSATQNGTYTRVATGSVNGSPTVSPQVVTGRTGWLYIKVATFNASSLAFSAYAQSTPIQFT